MSSFPVRGVETAVCSRKPPEGGGALQKKVNNSRIALFTFF